MASKKGLVPAKPQPRILMATDVQAEQRAVMTAWEALRLLSPAARYRAVEWLSSWSRHETHGDDGIPF